MATNTTCPKQMAATSNGAWQGDNPVNFALPLLILQICLVLAVTRILGVILKPLRQPRVIAEIIGGILLGPSALGKNSEYMDKIFPHRSLTVLETVADLGLIFFLFLVGLELDLRAIRRTGSQALGIAGAGIALPFVAGVGVSVVLHKTIMTDGKFAPFLVFMGVALSITAFPVLARILAERKLLTTDIGQMAMSAAAVNDVVAWILLALAVALSGTGKSPLIAIWVLLSGLGFVVVMFVLIRPIMAYIARHTIQNEPVNEMYVAITLAAVLAAGFATDAIGIHSIFGAFVFGLIVPKEGPFAGLLIEKLEDLVTILMLPLYFASSGLKTNVGSIHGARSFGLLVLVIAIACAGKIIGTFTVATLHGLSIRKALTLGFLMNTKGLVELIVLNIGKDRGVLNDETFAIMVLMALFTTFITTPVVMALYKPARNPVPYNRRTLYISNDDVKQTGPEAELRILAGVHGMPNVHAIINLVEAARGTRKRSLHMYILHLIELSERPSSIMKVQRVRRNGRPFWDDKDEQRMHGLDNIVVAFSAYGQLSKVMVRPMIVISRFDDMHEDICATANEKHAAIIILPFHKYGVSHSDGQWEGQYPGFRSVNQKVLLHAPCSVGILIDRGIGMSSAPFSSSSVDQNIAVLFYGGPDDREALALGYRMAEHPGVKLTVYRFVFGDDALEHATVVQVGDQHQGGSGGQLVRATGSGGGWGIHSHSSGGEVHTRFSLSSRLSIGPHETYDFMSTADVDWAHESKLDEECLALAKARRFVPGTGAGAGAGADQLSKGAGANTSTATSGTKVAAGGIASPSIIYVEKAISNMNKDDAVNAALEIVKSGGISLVVVGRGRRPSLLIAPLASRQAEFPELGPIGDALVGLHHQVATAGADQQPGEGRAGGQPSVLVVQQHDATLAQELVVSGSRRRHHSTNNGGGGSGGNKLAAKVVDISSSPIQAASALLSPHLVVVTGPSSSSSPSQPPNRTTVPGAQP